MKKRYSLNKISFAVFKNPFGKWSMGNLFWDGNNCKIDIIRYQLKKRYLWTLPMNNISEKILNIIELNSKHRNYSFKCLKIHKNIIFFNEILTITTLKNHISKKSKNAIANF